MRQLLKKLKKVRPGQPVRAEDWNAFIEALHGIARGDFIRTDSTLRKSFSDGIVSLGVKPKLEVIPALPAARPFEVRQVTGYDNVVQVTPGKGNWKGEWEVPTWLGGDAFDTDKTLITGTHKLQFRLDISVDGEEISSDAINIGWDPAASYEGLPSWAYDIDFFGDTVTETGYDAEVVIDIAEVTLVSSKITEIEQLIDYNPVFPWNRDIAVTVTGGGGSSP